MEINHAQMLYNLGGLGVKADGFDAKIVYYRDGTDNEASFTSAKTYNFLTGIDRLNEQGSSFRRR
ncbi:MAG: hypothetical protein R3C26_14350 [Calditrichia bacterium]